MFILLASLLGAATGWMAAGTAGAQTAQSPISVAAGTVATPATGTITPLPASTVGARAANPGSAQLRAAEPVAFSGQAAVSGRVIHDTVFGAPPVLEVIVDLSQVTGKGLSSGAVYTVQGQAIVHRPLLAFEQVEVGFSFAPEGNVLQARSAIAAFGVYYSAAKGMTITPVRIIAHPAS